MLQFTRPYEPERQPADLADLAARCLELARPRAARDGVALSGPEAAGAAWRLDLDPGQIQQVLLNLVLNGIDAAGRGGTVAIGLEDHPRLELHDPITGTDRLAAAVEITVVDDGPGFAEVDRDKLFQPFFTTKSSGTGLGLAISQKVVFAHGGEIRAEREGGRTRMRVLLPRQSMAGAEAPAKEAP
jgi:signal transduction histidine kinase